MPSNGSLCLAKTLTRDLRNGHLGTSPGWAEQPRYGGTLRIAFPGDPAFFNGNQGPAPGAQAYWLSNSIYNSLLMLTPPPELKIVPELAKSWAVLDDGRTYIF